MRTPDAHRPSGRPRDLFAKPPMNATELDAFREKHKLSSEVEISYDPVSGDPLIGNFKLTPQEWDNLGEKGDGTRYSD